MGWWSRLIGRENEPERLPAQFRSSDDSVNDLLWSGSAFSVQSVTGISINQQTTLNSTAAMACVMMLAEDVAKLPWSIFQNAAGENRKEVTNHYLYDLLQEPNGWQNGLEFREQMQGGLIMRGNAYAPMIRSGRGVPIKLIPVNPDWVSLFLGLDGNLFWRITPQEQHMRAALMEHPFFAQTGMFPFDDVLHIKGFSSNGLLGSSRIALAREAIALGLAQEQQAARWMGNAAKPSGMLTTDQKLTPQAAERLKSDIKANWGSLQNTGKMIIGEQGLKFTPFSMTSADLEFIASRKFQLEEVARIFRIPLHMIGELGRSTNNNIAQQAQEYINYTLTGYTNRWRAKMAQVFGLRRQGLSIEFDYRELTTADMTTRINNWRTMVMSMLGTPDEGRIDLGMPPKGGKADELQQPQNMAVFGSQSTGNQDGGGRPSDNASPVN